MTEEGPADAFSLMQRADALMDLGRDAEAVALLRQALTSDPDNPYAYVRLASALLEAGSAQDALEASEAAVRLAPDLESGHRLRAITLLELGQKRRALEAAQEAVRLEPDFPYALYTLVRAQVANRKRRDAKKTAERGRSIAPDDPDAHHMLGLVALESHKWKEAETHYRKALAIAPDHAVSINNLGVALRAQGRHKEAVDLFTAAAKADPRAPEARENLVSAAKVGLPLFGLWVFIRLLSALYRTTDVAAPVIIVLVVAGVGGFFLWRKRHLEQMPEEARRYVSYESRRRRPITMWRWAMLLAGASLLISVVLAVLYVSIIGAPDLGFIVWVVGSAGAFVGSRIGLDHARSRI